LIATVRREGGQLILDIPGFASGPVTPERETLFALPHGAGSIEFVPGPDGRAKEAAFVKGAISMKGSRIGEGP
jgi:hypothetical protein